MLIKQKSDWVHRREKMYNGIGGVKVPTTGKSCLPTALMLEGSKKILPGFLESHEQKGRHPLLLSDESQAKLGFIKDARDGTVYLKDWNDHVKVYRDVNTRLNVICISHFPRHGIHPEEFV